MAKMKVVGIDNFIEQLASVGKASEEMTKKMVRAGAIPIAKAIRANLRKNLQNAKHSTGDLEKSLGIAPVKKDKNGIINTKVGFTGYDRKGTPNPLKAAVMESGASNIKKRPFIRPAVNKAKNEAIEAMGKVFDEELNKLI